MHLVAELRKNKTDYRFSPIGLMSEKETNNMQTVSSVFWPARSAEWGFHSALLTL